MTRRAARVALAALVALSTLGGCALFDDKEPEPVSTRIPNEPPADAELVCGMDRASVQTAVGYEISRVEGSLDAEEGCLLWPVEGTVLRDWALSASLMDATSEEATAWREAITGGSADGVRPPEVRYDAVLGGGWRDLLVGSGASVAGGMSVVFAGDRVIVLHSAQSADGRDALADLLALTRQIAASEGLALDPAP